MFECKYCGKKIKSKAGLVAHERGCKKKEESVDEEEMQKQVEPKKEEIKPATDKQKQSKELSEDVQRKIKKLKDARKSMYDAKTRHDIDVEIKKLEEGK
jgi:hypothetical protein